MRRPTRLQLGRAGSIRLLCVTLSVLSSAAVEPKREHDVLGKTYKNADDVTSLTFDSRSSRRGHPNRV